MAVEKNIVYLSIEKLLDEKEVELLKTITNEYPEMNSEEKGRLVYDAGINGIISPLLAIKRDNKILIIDGRNRYNALNDLYNSIKNDLDSDNSKKILNTISSIPVEIIEDADITNLRMVTDSLNLSRRHLTATQKSIIAFSDRFQSQRKYFEEKSKENKRKGKKADENILNVQALADATGGNKEYTQRWKNVEDFFIGGTKKEIELLNDLKKHAYADSKKYQVICNIFRFPKGSELDIKDAATRTSILNIASTVLKTYDDGDKLPPLNDLKRDQGLPVEEATHKEESSGRGKRHNQKAGEMGIYLNFRLEKSAMEGLTRRIKLAFKEEMINEDFEVWFLDDEGKKVTVSDKIKEIAAENLAVYKSTDYRIEDIPNE